MKVQCLQENLNKGLEIVRKAVPQRTPLPILTSILLNASKGRLELTGCNLRTTICSRVDTLSDDESVKTVVPIEFANYIQTLPTDAIDLVIKEFGIEVSCGKSKARFACKSSTDFPPTPVVSDTKVAVNSPELKSLFDSVSFAAAKDDTRPTLSGICFNLKDGKLTAVAADGFQLAERVVNSSDGEFSSVIPLSSIIELRKLLPSEGVAEITITKGFALFEFPGVSFLSQLMAGSFPDYKALIPSSYATKVVLDRKGFLQAVKRVSVMGNSSIIVDVGNSSVALSAETEVGESTAELDSVIEGDPVKTKCNVDYLREFLESVEKDSITLLMTSPSSPLHFKVEDDYNYVLMPMF